MVENLLHVLALINGNLFDPLLGRITLSLFGFKKKQLRNGSLVIAPADYAKLTYHKLVSYRIYFEKRKECFATA